MRLRFSPPAAPRVAADRRGLPAPMFDLEAVVAHTAGAGACLAELCAVLSHTFRSYRVWVYCLDSQEVYTHHVWREHRDLPPRLLFLPSQDLGDGRTLRILAQGIAEIGTDLCFDPRGYDLTWREAERLEAWPPGEPVSLLCWARLHLGGGACSMARWC